MDLRVGVKSAKGWKVAGKIVEVLGRVGRIWGKLVLREVVKEAYCKDWQEEDHGQNGHDGQYGQYGPLGEKEGVNGKLRDNYS